MQPSCTKAILSLLVVATCTCAPSKDDPPCDCDYCNDKTQDDDTIKDEENSTLKSQLYKEDRDGDGDRTICARDRDFDDRTFPSVCHMFCYNRCLIMRHSTVTENDEKKYVAIAYRTNFYKLRDGEC
ncbi:uncharacterized protein LOC108628937 [Ceratina calcarata]|uniref:Uncharacterized protein LOC108628937 n=1 Tax=Ceratina calcarata TaxID=156304 RepID=A0AAJ7J7F8_9HYME|nr:uncharacterized protein LOC108628937 [Ceratina calcarata]